MKKYLPVILLIFLISSCKENEESIENKNIEIFQKIKPKLENSITYLKKTYLLNKDFKSKNITTLIPFKKNWIRKNIYYDKFLGDSLLDNNIRIISLRKDLDCDSESLPDIYFEISSKSNRQYYYTYHFCRSKLEKSESLNYKLIPLDENWNLEIEKN